MSERNRDVLAGSQTQAFVTERDHRGESERRQAPDDDVRRFRQALAEPGAHEAPARGLASGPFDLFRSGVAFGQSPGSGQPAPHPAHEVLTGLVARLLVADGREGQRAVRLSLDEHLLPGVEVSVTEEEGAWVAHFFCSSETSFERLAAPGPDLAVRLAQALKRASVWRVQAEDLPADGGWRRWANGEGERANLAEFRAMPDGQEQDPR